MIVHSRPLAAGLIASLALAACGSSEDPETAPGTTKSRATKSETAEPSMPRKTTVKPLLGVKRQPKFSDAPEDAKAETSVIRYLESIGGIDRWKPIAIDVDTPAVTITTSRSDGRAGLGLCVSADDAAWAKGLPSWKTIIILDPDLRPIARRAPGGTCQSLVG